MASKCKAVERITSHIDTVVRAFEIVVILVTGGVILYALLYGSIIRYFFRGSFPEEAELCWIMFTWMVLLGSSYVTSVGDHPTVTMFRAKMGRLYSIILYVVGIATLALFLYGLFRVPSFFWDRIIAPTLNLSQRYFYAPIIMGGLFWITRYVFKIIKTACHG